MRNRHPEVAKRADKWRDWALPHTRAAVQVIVAAAERTQGRKEASSRSGVPHLESCRPRREPPITAIDDERPGPRISLNVNSERGKRLSHRRRVVAMQRLGKNALTACQRGNHECTVGDAFRPRRPDYRIHRSYRPDD